MMIELNNKNNLKKSFIKYVIPAVIAQWVYTLYAIVDGIFVARWVSENAFAAVGLSYPFVCLLFSFSLMLAVGTSAVASIYMGKKQTETASERFTQNTVFSCAVGIVISVLSLSFPEQIAFFLGGNDPEIHYHMCRYISNIAPFSVAFLLSYSFEILMKADGFPERSTIIVSMGVVLNIILDYLFVVVLGSETAGAAFATGLTQLVLSALYIIHFLRKKGNFHFCRFRFVLSEQIRIIRNGISSGIVEFTPGIMTFIFNRFILMYLSGDKVVTYSIADYASCLIILSCNGFSQGAQPLISYCHGSGDEGAKKYLYRMLMISSVTLCLISLAVIMLFGNGFVYLFIKDTSSELFIYSAKYFRVFQLNLLLAGFNIAVSGYYTAVERAFEAMTISLLRSFLLIAVGLFLLTALFGGDAMWWSVLFAELITALFTVFTVLRKRL